MVKSALQIITVRSIKTSVLVALGAGNWLRNVISVRKKQKAEKHKYHFWLRLLWEVWDPGSVVYPVGWQVLAGGT